MPSPWVTGSELQADLEKFKPEAGWFLELKVEDEEGEPQGQVLIGVLVESTKSRHGGWQVLASFLSASDEYYRWWMTQGEGKKFAVSCPFVRLLSPHSKNFYFRVTSFTAWNAGFMWCCETYETAV